VENFPPFNLRELAKLRGYTSCFVVVAVTVAVAVAVACLLVHYSIKQFVKLPRAHAVWYPATAAGQCSSAYSCMQFGILPLQQGSSAHLCMQFGILHFTWEVHLAHSGGNDRFCARLKRTFRPLAPASKVI
jgi:hypothetical protein